MANKIKLTLNDTEIKKLKPALKGTRYDAWDIRVPGLSVRVTDGGNKTYSLTAKLMTEKNARRFTIDPVSKITLDVARDTARLWLEMIAKGQDPRNVVKAQESALVKEATDDQARRFCTVLSDYSAIRERRIKQGSLKPKTYEQMRHDIDTHILPIWKDRDIRTITTFEIGEVIRKVAKKYPGSARTLLSHTKTFFDWAGGNGYTIGSAAALLTANQLIGPQPKSERTLSTEELKAVWDAARAIGGPVGAAYMMLILTGCRLREVTEARWSEIGDLRGKLWTIPGKRMKKGKAHAIPLTDMMIEVLRSVPKGTDGDYIFSTSNGKLPFDCGSREKKVLNKLVGFTDWVNHDLRRTMRTMCSPLGIRQHIAEEMIAHAQPGIVGIYDHHEYLDEKREGFRLWNAEVARIVGWSRKLSVVANAA